MRVDGDRVERDSIGELFSRAIAEGKSYVSAEVDVVKQTALTTVDNAKLGVGMIVAGALLAYAGLIILLVALFSWLEGEFGPILAGLIVTGVTLLVSFLLIKVGIGKLTNIVPSTTRLK